MQSVTIDEAETYLFWVARTYPSHWESASNNHVLNSLLMRLFTSVFGVTQLSVRAPALIGAVIYICSVYILCRLLTADFKLQWLIFVCLVYNPFIFDYLVAARGYSMAIAFLTAALVVAGWAQLAELRSDPRWSPEGIGAACSVLVALSFAANFSFAFVDAAAMLAIFVWLGPHRGSIPERLRLLAACTVPGLIVTLFLTATVLMSFPKRELHYGAHSLGEMLHSVTGASLYQLNPNIVNPFVLGVAGNVRRFLFPLLAAFAVWQAVWGPHGKDDHSAWLRSLAAVLGATLGLTILAHWAAFRLFGLLLPLDRTGLFLAVLATMLICVPAAMPAAPHGWARRGLIAMLFIVSFYYLGCLRLSYFREWQWDADLNQVYSVLAYYNRTHGIRDFVSDWKYGTVLNFYRLASGPSTISEIRNPMETPLDGEVYVLDWDFQQDFIKKQGLRVVYRGPKTTAVVAIRPVVEERICRVP